VVISQGEIWWADLGMVAGSRAANRRPVLIIQSDQFNRSRIATVVCVPLTTNLAWAEAPGNVLLTANVAGLPKDSVANVSQIITVDKQDLEERIGKIPRAKLELVLAGVDILFGR
jgi:mRNA interferase MazF